jgi:LytTr DNA-binding domain
MCYLPACIAAWPKGKWRKSQDNCVNTVTATSALRQLQAHYRQPTVLAVLAAVTLVLGVSGPFHTLTTFSLLPRSAYWATIVGVTYGTGYFISRLTHPRVAPLPVILRVAATAFVIACAVTLILLVLNAGVGLTPKSLAEVAGGFFAVFAICCAIEGVGTVAHLTRAKPVPSPTILDRLPLEKRGTLIALSVRDHYVDVITTRGREMLLMRLSDAIRETQGVDGMQVHRSHWVARAQIARVRRQGDTATLTLHNNTEIPVSRAGLKLVQDAGMLPQRGGRGD